MFFFSIRSALNFLMIQNKQFNYISIFFLNFHRKTIAISLINITKTEPTDVVIKVVTDLTMIGRNRVESVVLFYFGNVRNQWVVLRCGIALLCTQYHPLLRRAGIDKIVKYHIRVDRSKQFIIQKICMKYYKENNAGKLLFYRKIYNDFEMQKCLDINKPKFLRNENTCYFIIRSKRTDIVTQ